MATATPAAQRLRARRGRTATHDAEALLDLVAAVARAAVSAGEARHAATVSMPVFNRLRSQVDAGRGVSPAAPERTPTADAIQMRFKQLAGRPVKWEVLVDGALRTGRQRTMWLSALSRDEPRDDLTDALVSHALRLIATRRGTRTLTRRDYDETRNALVAADRARNGDEMLLDRVLPSSNQLLAHCELRWMKALELAGLDREPGHRPPGAYRSPPPQPAGMPVAQVVAFYAALNGTWPSKATLSHFAASCNARMANPSGPMGPHRAAAAALLRAQGIEPPTRTRGGGKAKRMTYRYPVDGIPGAPPRSPRNAGASGDELALAKRRLYDAERRAFAVVSLRVWLAGLPSDARRVHREYVAWQVGSQWTTAGVFDKGLGGFSVLKQEAADINARVRQAGGDPLADALARAQSIRPGNTRARGAALAPARAVADPEPVPFAEALRAVLDAPTAEALAPRQQPSLASQ